MASTSAACKTGTPCSGVKSCSSGEHHSSGGKPCSGGDHHSSGGKPCSSGNSGKSCSSEKSCSSGKPCSSEKSCSGGEPSSGGKPGETSTLPGISAPKTNGLIDIAEDHSCHCSKSTPRKPRNDSISAVSEHDATVTSIFYKLVNGERQNYGLGSLARSEPLHRLARRHATHMANAQMVIHSVSDLRELRTTLQCPVVGENVQRGNSPHGMHMVAMEKLKVNRDNILDNKFREYGVAASRGGDGKLYLCQLFR